MAQSIIQMSPFRRNLVRQSQTVGLHLVINRHNSRGRRTHIHSIVGLQCKRNGRHGHLVGHRLSPFDGDYRLDDGFHPVNVLKPGIATDEHVHQTVRIGGVPQALEITSR